MINKKILIIGYGYWGKIIKKNLLDLNFQNIIICDIRAGFLNYKEIEDVFAVFICTPLYSQFKIAEYFIKKKVHVFSEKIFTKKINYLKKIYYLSKKNNVHFQIGFLYLFNNNFFQIKEYLNKKKITKPIYIYSSRKNFGPVRHGDSSINDLLCHDISLLNNFLDLQHLKINKKILIRKDHQNIIDSYNIEFRYKKSLPVVISGDWSYPNKVRQFYIQFKNDLILFEEGDNFFKHYKFDEINKVFIKKNLKYKTIKFRKSLSPLISEIKFFFENVNSSHKIKDEIFSTYHKIIKLVSDSSKK